MTAAGTLGPNARKEAERILDRIARELLAERLAAAATRKQAA